MSDWVRQLIDEHCEQIAEMRRSLEMFESGQMRLFHNRVDVSEGHIRFLRNAIDNLERANSILEGKTDA